MIWRRLKKASKEDEERFREQMANADLTFKDKFAMVISAYAVLLLPAVAVLLVLSLIVLWIFGAF